MKMIKSKSNKRTMTDNTKNISQEIRQVFLKSCTDVVQDVLTYYQIKMCGIHQNHISNMLSMRITSAIIYPNQHFMKFGNKIEYDFEMYKKFIQLLLLSGKYDDIKDVVSSYLSMVIEPPKPIVQETIATVPSQNTVHQNTTEKKISQSNSIIINNHIQQSSPPPSSQKPLSKSEFNGYTVAKLREICRNNNLPIKTGWKKDDIVHALYINRNTIKV